MHKCLVADVRLAGMLDTHLCFIFPLYVLPDRPLQSTLEPRSRSTPEATTTTSSTPLTKSSLEFPGRRPRLSICVSLMSFVLAFLRQNLTNYVCTQILCLYNFVFGSL